jgi:hypothetical protein
MQSERVFWIAGIFAAFVWLNRRHEADFIAVA